MTNLAKRSAASYAIKRMHANLTTTNIVSDWDVIRVDLEQQTLDDQYERFQTAHKGVLTESNVLGNSEIAANDSLFQVVETQYTEASAALKRRLASLDQAREVSPTSGCAPITATIKLELEPMKIPNFSGDLLTWLQFKDAFETLIHNNTELPVAYKLQMLRNSVKGPDMGLFRNAFLGNYEELWTTLKKRYDNPNLLVEAHVSRFLGIPPAEKESPRELLRIVDSVEETLRALRVMGEPVDSWNLLTMNIVISKLPKKTRHAWDMHCPPREISSLADLLQFLELRGHSLGIR